MSDLEKREIENKQKFTVLLISSNKNSLRLGSQTYFL